MEGITTALVAFIFVCIVYPKLVRNKAQFYMAIVAVLGIMLMWLIGNVFSSPGYGFYKVTAVVMAGVFQVAGFLLLILGTGGLSLGEFTGEIGNALNAMQHPDGNKSPVVPMTGEMPRPRGPKPSEGERVVYNLNDPPPMAPPAAPARDEGKIPLE